MILDALRYSTSQEEPCWGCLKGKFGLGLGGARKLDEMPSFWGYEEIDLPTWKGRDPLHIFATILEFFAIFVIQEANKFCVKTEWEIFEEMLNIFSFLDEHLKEEILNRLKQKRVASWDANPLKTGRHKLVDEIIRVVRELLKESDTLDLEYNNLLRPLLGELKNYKAELLRKKEVLEAIQEQIKGQLYWLLAESDQVSLRVSEVLEFLKQQQLDLPRLLYLLMFFWSDKYKPSGIESILGNSWEIVQSWADFREFKISLGGDVFLQISVENIERQKEDGEIFYKLKVNASIVKYNSYGKEMSWQVGEETSLPNYRATLTFPFEKLKDMWYVKIRETRPSYLKEDLQNFEEELVAGA